MHDVRFGESDGDKIVNMGGKAAEARLVAHEAVEVDEQQAAASGIVQGWVGDERLSRR